MQETRVKKTETETDKTGIAYATIMRLKSEKRKGQVILHLDGSGIVAKVETKVSVN